MKTPKLSERGKNILCIIISMPIFLVLLLAGVCKAYEVGTQWYLENALTSNVQAAHSTAKACEDTYQALVAWKESMKVQKLGTGSPCPLN